ncbi:substrate-binding domain-containing protein [Streptomyces sp. RS10V-4]|uniref:substrate-binding domain-containing protein n=1 Tax=Streptomyces rhizoryzae TaxID=2932493 RepID=UPI00200365E0|nr:substrate-binding domain-containing protein [Streptomyces rhizoryzae]MCK7627916.1 substrate-binding domain-containing protein [Streptomyces rhizoryzae]
MGRHSLPDDSTPHRTGSPRPRARRRTAVIATAVAVTAVAGALVALRGGLLPFGRSCGGDSVRLEVVASPDVAPALEAVAGQAREDGIRSDGKCLDVSVNAQAASEVADALAGRPADPAFQVWVPDSSLWVDRVTDERGSSLTAVGSIASSPIVLGAVPSAAKTLGWPGRTYPWTGLAGTAAGGGLRLGVADPAHSATGLLALARIGAADGKEAGTRAEAATRTAAAAALLSERVVDGDGQLLATLPRDGSGGEAGNPRRNQALLLSEQAAYAHNAHRGGGPALDLFYPTDGTARLDYPYTLVDDASLTADQSRAANRFLTLLADTAGQRTLRDHGFRADNGRPDLRLTTAAGGRDPQPYAAAPADPPPPRELKALLGIWANAAAR